MNTDLESIKSTLTNISKGNGILDTLIEFERTLDNVELFAYQNWLFGELVEGPIIERYWYKTVWMFPESKMPDPDGGLRITKIGGKVNFKKGVFKKPVKVKGPQDWTDSQSKKAKLAEHTVWLVTIELPIKYINKGLDQAEDVIQKDLEMADEELVDAYEESGDMPAEDTDVGGDDMQGLGNETEGLPQ